ncbi:PadR family transcriptional regulator [Gemella cuniculi]|uniref:PadR family transcriptional regulator n=1 Tax=Gemella cuniculi TaxID=150240 RepID=UPI0003F92014|nr:PadR family transcriptional regulator [Gemella cuniculi]
MLKYAILGLLNRKGMSGYDLTKEFDKELVNFWNAKHSQIYPELKKLEESGLIEHKVEISGEILEKKIYYLTKEGREDLVLWLLKKQSVPKTSKDSFKLQIYLSEILEKEDLVNILKDYKKKRQAKYAFLYDKFNEYKIKPKIFSSEFSDYLVLKSAIMREDAYIEWLNWCLNEIEIQ